MKYKDFLNIAMNSLSNLPDYSSRWDDHDGFTLEYESIVQRHLIGGADGGNCWGGEAKKFTNHNSPQHFLPLDTILATVTPGISYLKYREIESLITESEDNVYEYYGNHRDYTTFKLDIRELYDKLFPHEGNE